MQSVAFYAHLGNTAGVALRDTADRVSFQAEATGLWQTLTNADLPRLVLHGHCAIAVARVWTARQARLQQGSGL